MRTHEITVIGGGISGLSFAHYAALNGHDIKIYEKEQKGGCIKSYQIKNQSIDFGAHTLTNKYANVIEILEYYQATDQIAKPLLLKFEGYGKHRFFSLLKKIHWIEMLRSIFRIYSSKKTEQSVGSYYSSIFGKKNYRHFFHYLFQAILCQNPDNYPAEQLFRKRERNKKYPKSFSLKEGVSQILDIINSNPRISLTFKNITKITQKDDLYELWSSDEKIALSKYVCLACDPKTAAKLIRQTHSVLAQLLKEIPIAGVDSLLVGSSNPKVFSKRSKSIIGFEQPFYSAIFYPIGSEKYWLFHFKESNLFVLDKLSIISKIFSVQEDELYVVASKSSLLPAISMEMLTVQQEIDNLSSGKPIFIVGNYLNGLAVEDCCSRAKLEATRFLNSSNN